MEIKSCRAENDICFVGGLQEHLDLTYMNGRLLHQEVCDNQQHPSLTWPLKMLFWNPSGSSGFGRHEPPVSLCGPAINFSLLKLFNMLVLFGLTVRRAYEPQFSNCIISYGDNHDLLTGFFFFFLTNDAAVNIYVHKSWCSCVIISIGSVLHVKLLHQMFLKLMKGVSGAWFLFQEKHES